MNIFRSFENIIIAYRNLYNNNFRIFDTVIPLFHYFAICLETTCLISLPQILNLDRFGQSSEDAGHEQMSKACNKLEQGSYSRRVNSHTISRFKKDFVFVLFWLPYIFLPPSRSTLFFLSTQYYQVTR